MFKPFGLVVAEITLYSYSSPSGLDWTLLILLSFQIYTNLLLKKLSS